MNLVHPIIPIHNVDIPLIQIIVNKVLLIEDISATFTISVLISHTMN